MVTISKVSYTLEHYKGYNLHVETFSGDCYGVSIFGSNLISECNERLDTVYYLYFLPGHY